jgi:signal peptidase II
VPEIAAYLLMRVFALLALLTMTVGCDRVTKHWAVTSLAGAPDRSFLAGTLQLEYAENEGGFLSIGSNLPPSARLAIFSVATSLMLIGLLIIGIKYHRSYWHLVALSLAFAGGVSNVLDRITRGTVVDFMTVGVGHVRTGVFNVADVAILAGICMFVISRGHNPVRR